MEKLSVVWDQQNESNAFFWGGFLYWGSRLKGWDYANPAAGSWEIVGAVQASRMLGFFASVVTQDGALNDIGMSLEIRNLRKEDSPALKKIHP